MRATVGTGTLVCALLAGGSAFPVPAAQAGDAGAAPAPVKREIIPGSELMTPRERERYRQRIRGAKTPQEEEKVRGDHLHQVQERARLRGLRLPEADAPAGKK